GAALWRAQAAELAAAVNATLRRPDGVYVDGVDADGAPSGSASQEANALALAYGVVPATGLSAVGAHVEGLGIDLGPNHGLELLRGLAAAGLHEAVVRTLTDASIPGWAHIVAVGGTFTWEQWSPSDLIGDSMSHGWGSSALVAMQETLLGVTFMAPDQDGTVNLAVTPPTRGLAGATGSVPTIAGPLAVAWERGSGGRLTVDLSVPPNATALVTVPASEGVPSVRESGIAVERAPGVTVGAVVDGVAQLSVGSGRYRFTGS
ncbi:MAG TPA: alpha-L-rhamnosidase C-terminal domain-containing protein, partial [Acidimicrobiales bacterium]|nr:alpha-L-rhamnosidase C-terminal domain-containing protein [Acidimicrobiales bacterium]